MTIIYIYDNADLNEDGSFPKGVQPIDSYYGDDNEECENWVDANYGSNDYTWSYTR